MKKGVVTVVLMVMAAAAAICPPLIGGVVIERTAEDPPLIGGVVIGQAGEAAAKTAEEGLGDIARKAIDKADKILNGSSNCKLRSFDDLPYLILFSLFTYFASACY